MPKDDLGVSSSRYRGAVVELEDFADPWEHVRMLQDRERNEAIVAALREHVGGARVLEIGTGTGLFACLAARLGATQVVAVEASSFAEVARTLVRVNGLSDRVEVVHAELNELEPRPVDVVFGELLNADPLAEGILDTYASARRWLVPRGTVLPSRLRLSVALVEDPTPSEVWRAKSQVHAFGKRFDLDTSLLEERISPREPYRYLAPAVNPLAVAPLVDIDLAAGNPTLPDRWHLTVRVLERARIGGAAVLFEAEMGPATIRSGGHFGVLVQGFARTYELPPGGAIDLQVSRDDEDRIVVTPVG